ncbi:MAG: VanZ family protein [Clostridiales Family XIII bacterium]|jgi:VanZ family protein|nr:VanZ family protein [Clostridiales Family XIII bacterium]
MRKMLGRPWVWAAAALAVVAVLAVSSSQDAETSNGYTMRVARAAYGAFLWLSGSQPEDAALPAVNYFLRKATHVGIFALLAVFLAGALKSPRTNGAARCSLVLAVVLAAAATDEFHQSFTGRSANAADVLIDMSGAAAVCAAMGLWALLRRKPPE